MTRSSPSKRSYLKMRQTDHQCLNLKPKLLKSNHVNMLASSSNESLIGRDNEYEKISKIIKDGLSTKTSKTIYISGPAGTGKTMTVTKILEDLQSSSNQQIDSFKLISINCMSFKNSNDFYSLIESNLNDGEKMNMKKQLNNSLIDQNKHIENIKTAIMNSKSMIVLLLDEIDQLQTRNQNVLNAIFRLPLQLSKQIILIGIANALDFTAKTMSWLKNGSDNFSEIRFLPYSKDQIVEIIENRLKTSQNDNKQLIDRAAIEFCARKIASFSGDIRKALDVCRRAIELLNKDQPCLTPTKQPLKSSKSIRKTPLRSNENIMTTTPTKMINSHEQNDRSTSVNIKMIMNVLNQIYGSAVDKIDPINDNNNKCFLPSDQQIILTIFIIYQKIYSKYEIRLHELRDMLMKICRQRRINCEGKTESDILNMCQYLSDYGYVTVNHNGRRSDSITNGGSPFKNRRITGSAHKTNNRNNHNNNNENATTLSLIISPAEAEQLISTFHRTIVDDAFMFV